MLYFYLLVLLTAAILAAVFSWFHSAARDVPDAEEHHSHAPTRLNPDQLRLLAYIAIGLICLVGAVYELFLYYGPGNEAPDRKDYREELQRELEAEARQDGTPAGIPE